MRDDHRRFVPRQLRKAVIHPRLLQRIDRGGRLVQNDEPVFAAVRARDGDLLPLSAGQLRRHLAVVVELAGEHRVKPRRKRGNVEPRAGGGVREHLARRVEIAFGDRKVVAERHLIAAELLEHRRKVPAQLGQRRIAQIDAPAAHASPVRRIHPAQQAHKRRFSRAVLADDRQRLTFLHGKADPVERSLLRARIGKAHVVKDDVAAVRKPHGRAAGGWSSGPVRQVEEAHIVFHRAEAARDAAHMAADDLLHDPLEHAEVCKHRRERTDADLPGQQRAKQHVQDDAVARDRHDARAELKERASQARAEAEPVQEKKCVGIELFEVSKPAEQPRFLEKFAVCDAFFVVFVLAAHRRGLILETRERPAAHDLRQRRRHEDDDDRKREQRL